jgi:anti-sigma regulatory factor (Ser/Thr protein kinase)
MSDSAPSPAATATVDVTLRSTHQAASAARAAVTALRPRLSSRAYDDLRVVVSELVTNSIVHGPGAPIRMTVSVDGGGSTRGEVADGGDGAIQIRQEGGPDSDGGRGLAILDTLTTQWGVYDGTHVWFELPP